MVLLRSPTYSKLLSPIVILHLPLQSSVFVKLTTPSFLTYFFHLTSETPYSCYCSWFVHFFFLLWWVVPNFLCEFLFSPDSLNGVPKNSVLHLPSPSLQIPLVILPDQVVINIICIPPIFISRTNLSFKLQTHI